MELFRLVGSIFVDNTAANQSISKTDEKAQNVGGSFVKGIKTAAKWGSAIVAGAATAATAVAAVSTKFIESYSDYEQLVDGVETLFGKSADVVKEYANKAYKTAGMTANQYMETVTSFSASLLQGLNGDTAKAASIADMAITDMSDNANKMGTDISSIENAYQGFAKQNYTMLDNLKLGYGGTKTEMERLLEDASKLSGVEYNIDNLSDVYEAIHVIQGEIGITGTTDKEATSTISGSIGMIKSKLENMKTGIGEAIAPYIKQVLSEVIERLPMIEQAVEKITPVIAQLFGELVPPLLELATSLIPLISDLIEALLPVVSQIISDVLPVIVSLLDTILPPLITIVGALLPPLLELLHPILELLQPIIELLEPILDLVVALIEPIVGIIDNCLKPIITVVTKVIGTALTPLKGALSGLITFIKGVFLGNWKTAWQGVSQVFKSVWEGMKTIFKSPINWIINGLNKFIRGINAIKIPDWVPVVGGKGFHINTIPLLAKGGILEKGQTGYLEGTGAEAVVPLENNRKWIKAVADQMDNATGGSGSIVAAILGDILDKLKDMESMGVYLDTGKLVGGLVKPMDKELGRIKAVKARS